MNETQMKTYKQAMDKVVPDAALNARVMEALRLEMLCEKALVREMPQQKRMFHPVIAMQHSQQLASLVAAIVLAMGLLAGGGLSYILPVSWIDVDINPSVELGMNLYQRVVSIEAMNEDGEVLVSRLSLKGKQADTAMLALVREAAEKGYFSNENEAVISLTVIDKRQQRSESLAASAKQGTHTALSEAGLTATVIGQVVEQHQMLQAEALQKAGHKVSAGKLLLIEKLATLEAQVENSALRTSNASDPSNASGPSDFDASQWYGASVREIQEQIDAHRDLLLKQQAQQAEQEARKEAEKAQKAEQEDRKEAEKAQKTEQEALKDAEKAERAEKANQEALKDTEKAEKAEKEADKIEAQPGGKPDPAEADSDKNQETSQKPDQATEKPEQVIIKPDHATEKPDQATEKPDKTTEEPDQATEEPDKTTEEPDKTTEKPELPANANVPEKAETPGKSADTPAVDKAEKPDKQ